MGTRPQETLTPHPGERGNKGAGGLLLAAEQEGRDGGAQAEEQRDRRPGVGSGGRVRGQRGQGGGARSPERPAESWPCRTLLPVGRSAILAG